jgi:hypothetical protein
MTRQPLYLAAPYSDASSMIRQWHTARAALLCRLATLSGYSAVCVHPTIAAGGYGDDSDPEQRAAGLEATLDLCRGVMTLPNAAVWALLRDDSTPSEGTAGEMRAAVDAGAGLLLDTWKAWRLRVRVHAPHLLPEWDALATRPDAVGEWRDDSRRYQHGGRAAVIYLDGWITWDVESVLIAEGPETGALGRAAADAALRAAGVMR